MRNEQRNNVQGNLLVRAIKNLLSGDILRNPTEWAIQGLVLGLNSACLLVRDML